MAESPRPICIAIDGPAASGKGTVARTVARTLGYRYLDTGAMYRAVAVIAAERGVPWSDADAVAAVARSLDFDFAWDGEALRIQVDGRDLSQAIRTQSAGEGASAVAVHPPVRRALVARQQAMAAAGGVVMDGRDIGTVVLPDAELKVFLTASLEERARRRCLELEARGRPQPFDVVFAEVEARDRQDSSRADSPLREAPGAMRVDTTTISAEDAARRVVTRAVQAGAVPPAQTGEDPHGDEASTALP